MLKTRLQTAAARSSRWAAVKMESVLTTKELSALFKAYCILQIIIMHFSCHALALISILTFKATIEFRTEALINCELTPKW